MKADNHIDIIIYFLSVTGEISFESKDILLKVRYRSISSSSSSSSSSSKSNTTTTTTNNNNNNHDDNYSIL